MKTVLIFIVVVLSALAFRITNLDLIEFKTDEAINLLLSSRPQFGYPFPFGGTVSSVGVLNPPLFNYLLFPLTLISLDPKLISFFIGLINSIAIGSLFILLKSYYGKAVAFITAIILALSPWAILYSRKIWTQDLIFPFFVVLLLAIHKIVVEKNQKYWALFSATSLFLIQLHQINIFLILLLMIFLLRKNLPLPRGYLLLGLIIGLLPLLPYIIYELQSGCPDCFAVSRAGESFAADRSFSLFLRSLQILNQGNFYKIFGDDFLTFAKEFPLAYNLRLILYAEYLLIPLGLLIFIGKFKNLRFLTFVVILLPFIYFLFKIEPLMHYFIIISPLVALFLALAFTYLFSSKNIWIRLFSFCLLISLFVTSVIFNLSFSAFLSKYKSTNGDYGTTFGESQYQTKKKLSTLQNEKDFQEIFLATYIPDHLMYGYLPLANMLYNYRGKENQLETLEKKLKETPEDPRSKHIILALHTQTPLSYKSLDLLRQKSYRMKEYSRLYELAYNDYLGHNLKKVYDWQEFNLTFEYPQHWLIEEDIGILILQGDGYRLLITPALNKKKEEDLPFARNVVIQDREFSIAAEDLGEKNIKEKIKTIDEIIKSMRTD